MKRLFSVRQIAIEREIDELLKKRAIIVDYLFYEGKYTAQSRLLTAEMAQNTIKIKALRKEWRLEREII